MENNKWNSEEKLEHYQLTVKTMRQYMKRFKWAENNERKYGNIHLNFLVDEVKKSPYNECKINSDFLTIKII